MSEITEFLYRNFQRPHSNKNIWTSYEEIQLDGSPPEEEMVLTEWTEFNVTHANKDFGCVKVLWFGFDQKDGQIGKRQANCKIELYLNSYYTWDTFFEGYVPNLATLKIILDCIGIPYIN